MSLDSLARRRRSLPSWAGAAFIVEAMLLLVFLIASVAVFTQLFAASVERSTSSSQLTSAVTAAENAAERFAANPSGAEDMTIVDGLTVVCDSTGEQTEGGTLYHATISVYAPDAEEPVYELVTAAYESGV